MATKNSLSPGVVLPGSVSDLIKRLLDPDLGCPTVLADVAKVAGGNRARPADPERVASIVVGAYSRSRDRIAYLSGVRTPGSPEWYRNRALHLTRLAEDLTNTELDVLVFELFPASANPLSDFERATGSACWPSLPEVLKEAASRAGDIAASKRKSRLRVSASATDRRVRQFLYALHDGLRPYLADVDKALRLTWYARIVDAMFPHWSISKSRKTPTAGGSAGWRGTRPWVAKQLDQRRPTAL